MSNDIRQEAETPYIIDVAKESVKPYPAEPGSLYIVKEGENYQVIDTDKYSRIPRLYRRFDHNTDDMQSFIHYMNANGPTEGVEIWAQKSGLNLRFQGIFDAHGIGEQRINLIIEKSERYKEWQAINRAWMTQEEIAEFLEDHADELIEPDAATMLEIAQSMRATKNVEFQSSKRLANGETELVYKEEIEGRAGKAGKLAIPEEITIGMQPYTVGRVFKIKVKFRYRLSKGNLMMGMKMLNTDKMVEHVFEETLKEVDDATPFPIYRGAYRA